MFQAKLRGWRRLAAGLVLVPGLTGLGADALGLLGRASGQDRPPASSRADDIRDLQQQGQRGLPSARLGWLASYPSRPAPCRRFRHRGCSGRKAGPAHAADQPKSGKPATSDPKLLVDMAKQALAEGNLDKAQDLATQAQANSAGIRWGLFDDTPASVLKDIHKARGRRDKDAADRLLTEARAPGRQAGGFRRRACGQPERRRGKGAASRGHARLV